MPLRALALVALALVLAFYAELLAHAPATGQDFRLFYAAATVLRHGGNPYDQRQLVREEVRLYHPVTPAQRASLAGNPLPQGPPLVIALLPLVGRSPALVYKLYTAVLAMAAIAALILLSRLWPARRAARRVVLGLLSPVTFLGLMLGQPDALLLLAAVVALWALMSRPACNCGRMANDADCGRLGRSRHQSMPPDPALGRSKAAIAGFVLAMGLIKPQIIAGPIALLAVLAWRQDRLRPYLGGLLAGLASFVGLSVLLAGPAVVEGWIGELVGFSQGTVYAQVDVSSLSTLYLAWAPHGLAQALSAATLLAWAVLCLVLWRAGDTETHRRWWFVLALTLWLLATPYAHPHDVILLLPAAWYLLDRAPYRGGALILALLLCATWWLLPMGSVLGLRPPLLRGLGIVPVLLLATLLMRYRPARQKHRAMAAAA